MNVPISYYLSRFLNRDIKSLRCPRCNEIHLDTGYFATSPHRRHLCQRCGHYFSDDSKSVSNPLAALNANGRLPYRSAQPVRADRTLDIRQDDFPGGLQVWASNKALVWTADRPEEEGLHVHAFRSGDDIEIDETYSCVRVDGKKLHETQIKYFMAQQCLVTLRDRIVSLSCPLCLEPHFDIGEDAFAPHSQHLCSNCGGSFVTPGRHRMVVSNPFVSLRARLRARQIVTNRKTGSRR